jgi:hypothetical protein
MGAGASSVSHFDHNGNEELKNSQPHVYEKVKIIQLL